MPSINLTTVLVLFSGIKGLKQICNNIIKILTKQSPLHEESALLSRFLYKFDRKFRNDIGYRYFKKVHIGLKRYLFINLLKDIENFSNALPSTDDEYVPTRQMLEYVLVRLITFSKIMLRICTLSKQAAIFYLDRVKRGESHWMCLMPYALLSRVWSISLVLLQHGTQWYSSLHSYLNKLVLKGLKFLPDNYKLPDNLESWLDLENLDNIGRLEWAQKKAVEVDSFLGDNDSFENILDYVNQINEDNPEVISNDICSTVNDEITDHIKVSVASEIDQGEAISRESFKVLNDFQKKLQPDKYLHNYELVTDITTLKQFIEKEELLRNENNNLSLTSHLSFMQWQALKMSLEKFYTPLSSNRKIEKKFKKIWKEKCLDYL